MRVVTDSNETIELGITETAPSITITDYSRRITDAFGVTTVVPRKFSRRLSARFALATTSVDAVQRRLAGLRASTALWIADDLVKWLSVRGFVQEFEFGVSDPQTSFCTLSVEGLAETETVADNGAEPAPAGAASSLRLLQPIAVTSSTLVSSTVAENDYTAWASGTTYAKGARAILTSTHRVYESAAGGNVGNNPTGASGAWIDVGPTNRWAMFDEALGTSTLTNGSLTVVLNGSATNAIALIDVTGATVRVQASGYDRSQAAGAGAIVFGDLPNVTGQITVTVTGSGAVAVGTLLIGRIVGLGITEASPTAGITDYSRKEVNDFGDATVVQRAWAKRMSARALIRTDAVDQVANRIAAVRARPCLWIADQQLDSVTIYGFFKDFSIEVGERVSKLSLSIEGLSKAAPIATAAPDAGGLTPRGNYDPAVTYNEGDVVQYDGSSWYFIQETPSSGHAPPLLPATENAYWRVFAQAGRNGEDAPLVLVQWSVDGMTNWHANYADGDLYQRQSNDNGATWGPAVRVVGEGASAGADGISTFIIFRRLATVPATPQQDTGNPPPGWSDGPPTGTDLLWQSVGKFRGGTQLGPWSAPVRITGPAGAGAWSLPAAAANRYRLEGTRLTKISAFGFDSVISVEKFPQARVSAVVASVLTNTQIGLISPDGYQWALYVKGDDTPARLFANFGDTYTEVSTVALGDQLEVVHSGNLVLLKKNGVTLPLNGGATATTSLSLWASFLQQGAFLENVTFAQAGQPGANAPLVRVQWSIDGVSNWHDNYMGADVYQRQSNDGGATWGPAYRVIGENGTVGQDGSFTSFVFRRSATVPAAPADNSGNPPSGWTDGPPAGTDFLWQSKATFRGATQLTSWSAPVRISGEDGMVVDTETTNFVQPVFSTGANKPAWTGGSGTIRLNKGGQRVTSGVTYAVVNNSGVANLSVSGDTFSFSGAIDDVGAFTIRATYAGQSYDKVVTVKKVYDGEAAFKGAIPLTNGSGTSSFSVPAGRQTIVSGQATYQIGGSQVGTFVGTMALYWRNKTDNGPTNFLGQVEGTAATSVNTGTSGEPVYDRKPGTVSAAFSFVAPSPSKEIEFSVVVTRSQGNATATISGSAGMEVRS